MTLKELEEGINYMLKEKIKERPLTLEEKSLLVNHMVDLTMEEVVFSLVEDCNYIPNIFYPNTKGKRLWKKKIIKRGGEFLRFNKHGIVWKQN